MIIIIIINYLQTPSPAHTFNYVPEARNSSLIFVDKTNFPTLEFPDQRSPSSEVSDASLTDKG
jgi:hypothetical protein